jgi:hypothetical protein
VPATVPAAGELLGGNVFTVGRSLDSLKGNFFDRAKVEKAVGRRRRALLSKAGAFVRTRAISSMLGHNVPKGFGHKSKVSDRSGVSAPGQPPFPHTGLLVKWILFAWDQAAGGVVVGPMKTNQVFFDRDRKPVTGTVPQVLEYGGRITVLEWYLSHLAVWVRADLRFKRKLAERPTRYRTVAIAARPFMRPALAAEAPNFPSVFKDSLE